MDTSTTRNLYNKKNRSSLDGLMDNLRRFARKCREADAMIRRL